VDFGSALERGTVLAGSRMKAAPIRGWDRAVERIPQELMAKVVTAFGAEWVQHAVIDELLQRRLDGGHGQVHDPGENLRHEAPPDHGAGTRNRLGLGRPAPDSLEDGILDRVGYLRIADRPRAGAGSVSDHTEQLLDVEGNAIGALVHGLHDLAWRREAGVEDERRRHAGLVECERFEAHFLGQTLGEQPCAPVAQDGARPKLVVAIRAEEEHGSATDVARQLADDLEAEVVSPLEVLERKDGGAVDRLHDPLDDVADEEPPFALL